MLTAASTWPKLEIRLLGEARFTPAGESKPLKFARPRCIELLALCILNAPHALTRAAVCAHLWPDDADEEARGKLRRHLSELARALEPFGEPILADRQTIRYNTQSDAFVDVLAFEQLASNVETQHEALALYRSDLLAANYEDWLFAPRERLRALAVQLAHSLGQRALRAQDFPEALSLARRALELSEWREDSLRLLMTAMYAMGNRPGALAEFERFEGLLASEMHVEPMGETLALRDAILADAPLPEMLPTFSNAPEANDDTPFVGRASEVRTLLEAWDRASRGAGSTIFVGGDAGIGKTRLVREFARAVEHQEGHVFWSHASPDATTSYQPIVDIVRAGLRSIARGSVDDLWLALASTAVPELSTLHSMQDVPTTDAANEAPRLREAFARTIDAIIGNRPTLLVIEDMHWSDPDTIEMVAHLARRIRGSHALLLLTHRSEEVPLAHPLRALRRTLLAENRAQVLALPPLDANALAELAAAFKLDASVAAPSGGNPLFAVQLLQHYTEHGSSEALEIDSLVSARIARLSLDARTVLNLSALIDVSFTSEELAEIAAYDEAALGGIVETLLDARLLKWASQPGFRLTFAHQLLRDATLRELPRDGRESVHRRIACVLERTRGRDDSAESVIARHFELGNLPDRAYERYLHLAEHALAISALRSAIDLAHSALRVARTPEQRFGALRVAVAAHTIIQSIHPEYADDVAAFLATAEGLDEQARFEALLAEADYCTQAVDLAKVETVIAELLARAEASGLAKWRAQAHEKAGLAAFFMGHVRESIDHYTRVLDDLPPDSIDALCARTQRVSMYLRAGETELGEREFEIVDRIAATLDSTRLQSRLGIAHQTLAIVREEPELFRAAGERLVTLGERVGAFTSLAVGRSMLAHHAYMTGDVVRGRDIARENDEFIERHSTRINALAIRINHGWCERYVGNLTEAIAVWERCLDEAERLARTSSITASLLNLAEARLMQGDVERAFADATRAGVLASQSGEERLRYEGNLVLGALHVARGTIDAGLAMMCDALEGRRTTASERTLSEDLSLLLETYARAGRLEEAAAYAQELRGIYAAGRDKVRSPARTLHALALAAEAAGDLPASKRYVFEAAVVLRTALERMPDEATRANFAALPYHKDLLERAP